ncbi:MAG: hypothetical protein WD770_02960 [Actinomycetota bacterium]
MDVPIGPDHDVPAERDAGRNAPRERRWGVIGGLTGSAFGVLAFVVAARFDHAPLADMIGSPYPPFLQARRILSFDWFLLSGLAVGSAFLVYGLVALHTGRYPRSDAYGSVLTGAILSALSGAILFTRLWAVLHAPLNGVAH